MSEITPMGQKENRLATNMKILEILKDGEFVQGKEIAYRLDMPVKLTQYHCSNLRMAGIIGTRRGPSGGYYLKKMPTVGQLYIALDLPYLVTGNKEVDLAFKNYLKMQL